MIMPMRIVRPAEAHLARSMAVWGDMPVYSRLCYDVPVTALRASQIGVCLERVEELAGVRKLPPIYVAKIGRRYVIVDGHHRACAAIRNGEKWIDALVFTRAETRRRSTHAKDGGR